MAATPRPTGPRLFPFLALAILAAAAAEPLARTALTCSDDVLFHLYRAVELGSQIALGHLVPRWAPDMALGYGYPFFNFYAPLSSYGVVLLHAFGLAYPLALRLAFALGLWLAEVGAFLFVNELWGEAAGLAAGAAYLFAPYLAYDVLFRGNLAESFAFVWPPLVLWGLARVMKGAQGLAALLAFAALILTHNIFAFIAAPLFAGYALLAAWQARSWRVLLRGALALVLGAALTAYFWAPALAERGLVHSDRLFVAPIFTWYTNFISPAELLAPPHAEDPLLINPSPPRAVGLLPALLCLPGLAAAVLALAGNRRRRAQTPEPAAANDSAGLGPGAPAHRQTLFFALALLGYSLLTLPISTPVWNLLTPLALVQFPWRMLGPAALCAAVLIGAGVAELTSFLQGRGAARWVAGLPLVLAVGAIYFGNLGWWYPRYCPSSPTATVADMVRFEIDSHTVGTTAKGEYIPLTAGGVPSDLTLAKAIIAGGQPSRLSLPDGATVNPAGPAPRDPLDATYSINASRALTATYQQFYYPGWSVAIDGQSVAAGPDIGTGLITFEMPAGTHTLHIHFGSTPLRTVASVVSLAVLLGLAIVFLYLYLLRPNIENQRRDVTARRQSWKTRLRIGKTEWPGRSKTATAQATPFFRETPIVLLIIFILLPVLRLTLIDRLPNPLRRSVFDPAAFAPVAGAQLGQHALQADFAGGLRLFGYDLSTTDLTGDGALDAALYLARTTASDQRYVPAFDIADEAGLSWQDPNYLPPRWQREPPSTPLWPLDQYAQWARHLSLLPGTPPGNYQLWGQVFDLDSQQIASLLDADGNAVAPRFAMGTLSVARPRQAFALQPPTPAAHDFGPITLLGYDLDRAAANAGDTLLLTLFWTRRGAAAMPADGLAQLSLVSRDGQPAFSLAAEPANGYPTGRWQPGDEWRGQTRLRLPAALPDGDYSLTVALPDAGPGTAVLAAVHVSAPDRTFQEPAIAFRSGAEFAGAGVLEGYSLTRASGSLGVSLVWRATATPAIGYSVFIHLQAAAGRVWAQSDAAPANWSRPTTGWIAGEYVLDAHNLTLPADLPPGTYTLWAGLYDPADGTRVPVVGPGAAADQRVALGQVNLP